MGVGRGFTFESAQQIWEEIRAVWPAGHGITYARLEHGGLQWPCPDEHHPGTTRLHGESFGAAKRATLRMIEHVPSPERVSSDFPFLLNTGRSLYQFNAGTMTMRTPNRVLRPTDRLDMSPLDGARIGLEDGERARIRSRYGEALLAVHWDGSCSPGQLFATFHDPKTWLNAVTGSVRDRYTGTPEYKLTAVAVEKLSAD
jgi:formate dehydrogenase major subunit